MQDGKRLYVANSQTNRLTVIDISTNAVTDTVEVSQGPGAGAVTPDGRRLYVTNNLDLTMSVVGTRASC